MPFGACLRAAAMVFLLAGLQACGGGDHPSPPRSGPESAAVGHYKVGDPYRINGRWYHPSFDPAYDETGVASWYGDAFQGRPTANGEVFDKNRISAAHTTLPLPSIVEVVNLENGRRLQLRVNDRGPFVGDRLIVCWNLEPWTSPDGPAMRPIPKEFAAPKGSGFTLLVFEMAKE